MMPPGGQGISTLLRRMMSSFELRVTRKDDHGRQLSKEEHASRRAGKGLELYREPCDKGRDDLPSLR